MSLFDLLRLPFRVMPRVGRAAEFALPSVFHPEQILSKSPRLHNLYNFTVKEQRIARIAAEKFKGEAHRIVQQYGLQNEDRLNDFLTLLEFPYFNKRYPNAAEIAEFSPDIKAAVIDHLQNVSDPIWKIAKKWDKDVGYIPGYFTHFPAKALRNRQEDELKRITQLLSTMEDIPQNARARQVLQIQADDITRRLQKSRHVDDVLNAMRYHQTPEGGRFGPLNESRTSPHLEYKKDYKDVMDEYIEGAMRKIFLDRYLPRAKKVIDAEPNLALREYAFDYVSAQRGALSSKRRLFLNQSLAELFPDEESGYRGVAKAVDYATRFQYLTKIGLSWFRFPFVNITQPLLTTYPMVGEKNFLAAYSDAFFHPSIWKEAKDAGVIFEATLRKGISEMLGRSEKLSRLERGLSWPAKMSEELNRVVTYAAGKRQAEELGLIGRAAQEHAINLVNRTQFLYHKEALPLIMSQSPAGRLIFQFRTFTANYVNFLTQLVRSKQYPQLARAVGSLMVLAGSAAIPFGLWEDTRNGLLRNTGVDIGEFNPIERGTEALGITPPLNFGASLEPFNIPYEVSQLFGPTAGPIVQTMFKLQQKPEEAYDTFIQFLEGIAPPVTRLGRWAQGKEVRTRPTKTMPQGRVIGERSIPETLFLRPSLESTRRKFIELIANAYAGGREDLANKFIERARRWGLKMDLYDLRQARARAAKLKGIEEKSPPTLSELEVTLPKKPKLTIVTPRR